MQKYNSNIRINCRRGSWIWEYEDRAQGIPDRRGMHGGRANRQ